MKSERLMLLGLALVVMCNAVSTDEATVQPLGESDFAEVHASSLKGLLAVPGIPKNAKLMKRIEDMSESACKTSCDSDKNCMGFQYVAAEHLCKLLSKSSAKKKGLKGKSVKKALKKAKRAAKKMVKKEKKKEKKKMKKALKAQKRALAPKKKKPTPGQIYRMTTKRLNIRVAAWKKAKAAAKEAGKKNKGAKAAEGITKVNEHHEMMKELRAAKHAQEMALNFEEQILIRKSRTSKEVLVAKGAKVGAMAAEEKQDAKFEDSKVVMKKGLELASKMKKITAESKNKVAGANYKAAERKAKNKADEKKEKLAKKARLYLKRQNKKAERHNKAVSAAKGANSKKKKLERCHK